MQNSARAGSTIAVPGLSRFATYSDDFSEYKSTEDLRANIARSAGGTGGGNALYSDGLNGEYASLDTTVRYNGHATMKYTQPGGQMTTPQLYAYFKQGALGSFWFRVMMRFSPGFTTTGTLTNSANAYKLFGWGWDGTDGRGTLETTNTNQYTFNWGVTTTNNSRVGPPVEVNGNHMTSEWSDGAWWEYIVLVQRMSPTAVRERWWLCKAGQPPILQQDIWGRMTVGTAPLANRIMVGMNFNQIRAPGQTQYVWIGQWEIVDPATAFNPFGLPGL